MAVLLVATFACDYRSDLSDAYGNFEADDRIISAETTGKILYFNVEEGDRVRACAPLGLIDTLSFSLQQDQLERQEEAIRSKIDGIHAQIATYRQQEENVQVSFRRVENLVQTGAATLQQKDELEGQLKLIGKQIEAAKTQIASVQKELGVVQAQKNLLSDQFRRCIIVSPVSGTVLEKYLKNGELAVAGKPLFKMADLSELILRCYIDGDRLSSLRLGDEVSVLIDAAEGKTDTLTGIVSWISDEAEFTPKTIQTKKERVNRVYAVKIRVPNDGRIKMGMPGEMNIRPNPHS